MAPRPVIPSPFGCDALRMAIRVRGLTSLFLAALLAAAGCVSAPTIDTLLTERMPKTAGAAGGVAIRPVAQTLPLEVFFLRCEENHAGHEELWARVDEQLVDETVRRRLAANGLRAGILLGQLPEPILAALEPPVSAGDGGPPPPVNAADANPPVVRRVLRLLPGRESELVALKSIPDLVVLEQEEDGLRGANYADAVPHFTLKAWPAADGRVRVDLVPVIRHGPMERSFVGEDGAFKIETSQRKRVLDRLRCEVTVPADGLLIVGPAGEQGASVGDALFRPRSPGRAETRLLALRPLAPGVDPMFMTTQAPDALASSGDADAAPTASATD
jgi:hypothetical protein